MNNINRFQVTRAGTLALCLFLPLLARANSSVSFGSNTDRLGVNRRGLSFAWYQYHDSPVDASGYSVEVNWPIRSSLNFSPGLDSLRTNEFLGFRAQRQSVLAGLRIHAATEHDRSYVEADGLAGKSSFASCFEFPMTRTFTFTPLGYYEDYGSVGGPGSFNYDLKGHIMVGRHWAVTASVLRRDSNAVIDTAGVNVRPMTSRNILSRLVMKYQVPIRALLYQCAAMRPDTYKTTLFQVPSPFFTFLPDRISPL